MRNWYRSKSERTLVLFVFSMIVNAFLVLHFPIVSFYLAPLLLGVPHLFASLRYGHSNTRFSFYYLIWFAMFCFPNLHPAIGAGAVLLTSLSMRGKTSNSLLIAPAVITVGYLYNAYVTAMVLMMLHNFLAFLFWYREAKNPEQKLTVRIAFAFLLTASGLLYFAPATFDLGDLAQTLTGLTESKWTIWFTAVFLFSQSVHYFIWLKAIPDFHTKTETPLSFRGGDQKVREIFGKKIYAVVALMILGLIGVSCFAGWEQGRLLYIQLAFFHGFAEMSFLCATTS